MKSQHTTLGQWPNAPLALVVSQVRFHPNIDPGALCQKTFEATGDLFSIIEDIQQVSIVIGADGVETPLPNPVGKLLRNEDFTRCIHFLHDSITYNTSEYIDHVHFFNEWAKILEPLFQDGEVHITRCGLRYVDFIIPSKGQAPEDYVNGLGKSPSVLGEQSQVAFNAYDYSLSDTMELRVLYSRGFGPPYLPQELAGAARPPHALICQYDKGLSAVLDLDCWSHLSAKQTLQSTSKIFQELRNTLSEAFKKIITDAALIKWQKEHD